MARRFRALAAISASGVRLRTLDSDAPARIRPAPDDPARAAGQKLNLYLPVWMAREVAREAARLDRSVSWILRRAWQLARPQILGASRSGVSPEDRPRREAGLLTMYRPPGKGADGTVTAPRRRWRPPSAE